MSQKVYHIFDKVTNAIPANSQVSKLNDFYFKFDINRSKKGNLYKTLESSFLANLSKPLKFTKNNDCFADA